MIVPDRYQHTQVFHWSCGRLIAFIRRVVSSAALISIAASTEAAAAPEAAERSTVIGVAAAPGEAEFAPDFALQVEAWSKPSGQAGAKYVNIGASDTDRERLKDALEAEAKA